MSTRTIVAVAAIVAAAIIGGAIIWAISDDDSRRGAVLESTAPRPASLHTVTMGQQNNGDPIGIDSFSVGATRAATVQFGEKAVVEYGPLEFVRPLDGLSVRFFEAAAAGDPQGNVRLTLRAPVPGSSKLTVEHMRYDFGNSLFESGNESAPGVKPTAANQTVALGYDTVQIETKQEMPYAPATGAVGRLEIPNVTEQQKDKFAYLLGYSWGWQRQSAAEGGRFTVKSLTVERHLDPYGSWFWQSLITGSATPQMTLRLERPDASGVPFAYMTYTLSKVQVVSVRDSGGTELRQQVKLAFESMSLEAADEAGGPTVGAQWPPEGKF